MFSAARQNSRLFVFNGRAHSFMFFSPRLSGYRETLFYSIPWIRIVDPILWLFYPFQYKYFIILFSSYISEKMLPNYIRYCQILYFIVEKFWNLVKFACLYADNVLQNVLALNQIKNLKYPQSEKFTRNTEVIVNKKRCANQKCI